MEEKRPVTRADSIGSSDEKKDKKFKLNRNLLIYIAIILGVSMLLSAWIITAANDLLALDKPDEEIIVKIPKNATTRTGAVITRQGAIPSTSPTWYVPGMMFRSASLSNAP